MGLNKLLVEESFVESVEWIAIAVSVRTDVVELDRSSRRRCVVSEFGGLSKETLLPKLLILKGEQVEGVKGLRVEEVVERSVEGEKGFPSDVWPSTDEIIESEERCPDNTTGSSREAADTTIK